jgi:hypothetical protein
MDTDESGIIPDPALAAAGATIEKALEDQARRLSCEGIQALTDSVVREAVALATSKIDANSTTIWLASPDRNSLVVSHSWPLAELLGFAQPIDEGLISLVLGSEQAICENRVYEHAAHSKRVDRELSKITCSMIAAPFYVGGLMRGVFSCVKWKDTPSAEDPPGFSASDLSRVRLLSSAVERLLNYRIMADLLGLQL